MVRSNSLAAMCIIVSTVCVFSSISMAGYWVDLTNDDFETGFGNWTTDGSQCTWTRNKDNTPSDLTGPCGCYESGSGFDHTIGDETGWYAYVETSSSACQGGDLEAILEGPDLDADTYSSFALSFYYHMYGSAMGNLHVDVYNGTSWDLDVYVLSGQQQSNGTDPYLQSPDITLDSYTGTIKVRFRYNGVSGWQADVAIDDIEISGWVDEDDTTPPIPNPAEFDTVPAADSATSISMTATTGTDFSPPIEYSFIETSGNPGATNSGWTTSNTYTDEGLNPGTPYTYTVQMRDNSQTGANTGTASSGLSATTLGIVPDVTLLAQADAESNLTSSDFVVGSIGQAFSNTVPLGNVISQLPVAGTELVLGSPINLNVSKGTNVTDFEDLVVFALNWLHTDCGVCNDQDYSGDHDVDFEDFSFFSKKWQMDPLSTLVINEFMASNDSVIADGFGDYDDWFEIYNYGIDPVMMDGMHLADSANTYVIPPGITIDPNTYLIFWADDETGEGPLHTNFKLGAGGDEITLYESDGISLIDSIIYRADQTADISHGRYPDNTPDWYNMDSPTPGTANQTGMAGEVWFSKLSGTFTTERIDLELFTESPTAEIRYTIDGSMPTATSTLYTEPIWISIWGTARIRARAFDPAAGLAPGPVTGHYYIPLDADAEGFTSNLPIVVMDTYNKTMTREFRQVGAVFIDIDKDTGLAKIDDVPDYAGRAGLKLRGESSDAWPKKHYGLELWDENDLDTKASLFGMPSESDWTLNNPYGDKSLIRNVLAYKWANDIRQGFAAPGTKLVEVFVNDDAGKCSYSSYRGVYVLTEKIKASKNRLDIGNLEPLDNTEPDITGGYILRLDKDYPLNSSQYEEFETSPKIISNSDGQGFQYYDPDQ
ncbi:MAG: CotH kinase family protein, partial [Planctomycetota bacterium]